MDPITSTTMKLADYGVLGIVLAVSIMFLIWTQKKQAEERAQTTKDQREATSAFQKQQEETVDKFMSLLREQEENHHDLAREMNEKFVTLITTNNDVLKELRYAIDKFTLLSNTSSKQT